jgi:PAS domain S-box-containing protein
MSKTVNTFENFPDWLLKKWQGIADLLAEIIGIPAALIMKTENEFMEVFISSHSENNPYHVGEKEKWDGLYCETVIKTQNRLLVPNARKDKKWDKNPDMKLGMIAYLGFPINFPDNHPFGTLCVLDNRERPFTLLNEKLIEQFKNVIELDLALIQSYELETNQLAGAVVQEITARKREETLRESEQRLQRAQEIAHLGSWELDLVHNRLSWSDEIYRIFGLKPQEFAATYEAFLECVYPDDRQKVDEAYGGSLRENRDTYEIEHRVVRKDTGEVRVVHETCEHFRDATGKITRSIGMVQDITDRKRAEVALRYAGERKKTGDALKLALEQAKHREQEVCRLLDAAHAILECRTFEEAARRVFDTARGALGAASGYVALLSKDGEENEVLFLESGGLPCDVDPSLRMPIRGLRAEAYHRREAVYDNDFSHSQWMAFMPVGHVALRNVLFAPLIIEDAAVGLLGLANKPGDFTEADARLAFAFGQLVAIGLSNARDRKREEDEQRQKTLLLEKTHTALMTIAKMPVSEIKDYLGTATEVVATTLDIWRVSVWWLTADHSEIVAAVSYETGSGLLPAGERLRRSDYLRYFEALDQNRTIAAADARSDERTNEFTDNYLVPHGIISMMDVPIRRSGKVVGILCHEHRGSRREWNLIEQDFAASVADLITVALENRERMNAEETLRESEQQLRRAQEIAHLGSWELDLVHNRLSWSDEIYRIFGLKPQEFAATYEAFLECVYPDDRQKVDEAYSGSLRENRDTYEIEHRVVRKDTGEVRVVHEKCEHLRDATGKITRSIGMVQDITERKRAEVALRESEAQFRALIDATPFPVVVVDTDDNVIFYWSRSAKTLFGHTAPTATEWYEIAYPDPAYREDVIRRWKPFLDQAKTSGVPVNTGEYNVTCNDGSVRVCELYAMFLENNLIVTFNDITERKRGEEREIAAKIELAKEREIEQMKNMFIASMSHELRTPLNSIIGFTGMTLQGLSGELNAEQKDNLTRSYKSGLHLLNLITDVIDISKIEAGRIEVFIEPFPLKVLIDEAIGIMKPQMLEKGLSLSVNVPVNIQMNTDRKRLLQCLLNLLSNAVKYTEAGKISVTSKETNGIVEISVGDSGIGIAEKDIPKLFEAFERLATRLKIKTGGTGLGLYLTKKLMTEILHGEIKVQSREGEGSIFTLQIPKNMKRSENISGHHLS